MTVIAKKKTSSNRGSVTILAIGIMAFLGIILSGLLPMITQEVRSGAINRDVVEAQYAAEAGAKRALVEFYKIKLGQTPDWTWLNKDKPLLNNVNEKKYNVITYIEPSTTHVTPDTTATKAYTVQSTGTVNGAKKIVKFSINITAAALSAAPPNPLAVGDTAIYAGGNIEFKNNGVVNNASTAAGGNNSDKYNMNNPYDNYQYKSLSIPQYSQSSFPGAKTVPSGSNPALSGKYIVNGNWEFANNTNFTGDATIYVTGNIVLPQNFNFNGQFLIIAAGNIDGGKSNNNNFSKAVLLAYGNIEFKNNLNLNGTMIAAGNVSLKNGANVNFDSGIITHFGIPNNLTGGGSGIATVGDAGQWKSE